MKEIQKIIFILIIVLLLLVGLFFIFKPKLFNNLNSNNQENILEAIQEGKEIIEIELPKDNTRPSQSSCKPPKWCKIKIP